MKDPATNAGPRDYEDDPQARAGDDPHPRAHRHEHRGAPEVGLPTRPPALTSTPRASCFFINLKHARLDCALAAQRLGEIEGRKSVKSLVSGWKLVLAAAFGCSMALSPEAQTDSCWELFRSSPTASNMA